jgi:hypothetical protein
MNPANLIPAQFRALFYLAIIFAIFGAGWTANGWRLNAKADREAADRKQAESAAILTRIKNNERKVEQDKANSARIAKEHQREMEKVRADLAAERLRKPKWCDGPAEGTETDSPSGSNGADPASRLLPEAVESDIRRLIEETERAAATGRACQEFVRSNGMAPE